MPSPTAATLQDLVVAATAGDRDAFAAIVDATRTLVFGIALAELRDVEASRDVAQDVYLLVHRDLGKLRRPGSFLPFLREVARSRARRAAVRRNRDVGGEAAEAVLGAAPDHAPLPDERLAEEERRALLHEAFDALPEDAREVLALYYLEGRSTAQVSSLLGLGEAAVHQRLSRARGKLREDVERRLAAAAEAVAPGAAFTAAVLAVLPGKAAAVGGAAAALAGAPKWAVPAVGGAVAVAVVLALLPHGGGPAHPGPGGAVTVARPFGERSPGERSVPVTPRDDPAAAPSGRLRVMVTDGELPVPGATVRTYRQLPVSPAADRPAWRLAYELSAGTDGAVEVPAATGRWLVSARAPGLAAGQMEVYRFEGQEVTRARLALAPPAGLAGRVIERPSGAPVPLATLVLVRETGGGRPLTDFPFEEQTGVVADAAGAFVFPSVGPGQYALVAEAPGRARTVLRRVEVPRSAPLEVRLPAAAVLEGRVLDAGGKPAPGAALVLSGGAEVLAAAAGPSGGFSVEVAAGVYALSARAGAATAAHPGRIELVAGQVVKGIELRLGEGARIEGRVAGEGGRPVAGAVMVLSGCEDSGEIARTVSDAGGRYVLGPLAPGEYDVEAFADGHERVARMGITVLAGEAFPLDLVLDRTGVVEGQVTSADGRPLEGALVRAGGIYALSGDLGAMTGPDGRYRLAGVAAGQRRVQATRRQGHSFAVALVRVEPGVAVHADFVLPDFGTIEGTVLVADGGLPEGSVWVSMLPERSNFRNQNLEHVRVYPGADGRFSAQVAPGRWKVVALRTDRPAPARVLLDRTGVEVVAGEVVHLELPLPEIPPPLVVEVRNPGGGPGTGALVQGQGASGIVVVNADEDGRALFSIEGGVTSVYARRAGRAGARSVAAGENPITLELQPAAALRGRVLDPSGRAVRGFSFALELGRRVQGLDEGSIERRFAADRFALEDLPPGRGRVHVTTEDGRAGSAEVALTAGLEQSLDVTVQPAARVVARVADVAGRPIPAVLSTGTRSVTNDPEAPGVDPGALASGVLVLGQLAAGELAVQIWSNGYRVETRNVTLAPGETRDLGTVRLERPQGAAR